MLTIAIVAHNEEPYVENAIRQAREAADAATRVVVVDSASTDGTAARARSAGCEVLPAPLGKGAAMKAVARATRTPWLCFLDADIVENGRNIPLTLRRGIETAPESAVMVVADFDDPPPKPILSATIAVYGPLVAALVPEASGLFGGRPLSGFRAIRPEILGDDAPPDFGIEAYLNLSAVLSGRPVTLTHIGLFTQRFRYKGDMGGEISRAILDVAEAHGRLDPEVRPEWDAWTERVLKVIRTYRGDLSEREDYLARLHAVMKEPLPPRKP
ncbi:glycosyltransferase [Spirillospora sp. NPDC047279]|uniref:glycosyltransferase family 2 protein n=1 Tax=Spirillospora sp. NPDC047279 TaxID=3155478 RepID=UPI0033FC5EF4